MNSKKKVSEIICPSCHTTFEISPDTLSSITSQIRDSEFNKALEERLELEKSQLLSQKDIELEKAKIELEKAKSESEKHYLEQIEQLKETVSELKSSVSKAETEKELAIMKASEEIQKLSATREQEYKDKIQSLETENSVQKNRFDVLLAESKKEVEFYKDLKTKMSTKMIGETLEQHCETLFNQIRMTAFPNAYFDKDNDARTGSKGDYIYRECDENGVEIISIMFEMKNEADETATKHKNKDFFKELDKDRREKQCEYAVLVSLLETDNELYNAGITDVSYEYEKMYVIRPQCFIPIISLLRNAALNSLQYKQELAAIRSQELDLANFEDNLMGFKNAFTRNYDLAHNHFERAVDEIDKSIKALENVKEYLTKSDKQYRLASDKVSDVTIKKLTNNAPQIAAQFKQYKQSEENK